MSSRSPRPGSRKIRHRITEIELRPITSNRQISAKVLVDGQVACELPWIAKGKPLRWTRPIVCNVLPDSKITLEACEKHTVKDQRFRSNEYAASSVQQQAEVTVGFNDKSWSATFRLLDPATAEESFAAGLDKIQNMETTPTPLERLGKTRPVFKAILQFGSAVSELHPTAKAAFAVCTMAWEKLEEQEKCNESVQELIDGLTGITDFVELVKKHARMERLKETIEEILVLLEDVSIHIVERESTSSTTQTLRGFFDSGDQEKVNGLLNRFERLRAEFETGVGAETHKTVHMIDFHALLDRLHPVNPSGYDPSRACQDGTRMHIISDILSWTEQQPANFKSMLWIYGQAGMGKSSIATSVCQQLANEKLLAASFFCKRDDPNLRDPLRLINSVVHGLGTRCPSYGQLVAAAIQEDRELCTAHISVRYEGLIMKPLQKLEDPSYLRPLIILVDGLDECGTESTRRDVLRCLSDTSKLVPWLKVIVTSRPDGDIQGFFQDSGSLHVSSRNVHDFNASEDIRAYMEKRLGGVALKHKWPSGSIDQLCEKASGVFIWAATVERYIAGSKGSTIPRLLKVIEGQKSTLSDNLDALYTSVILAGMKDVEEDNKALFRQCIGAILVASTRRPLSISELGSLLLGRLDSFALDEVVNSLGAVLHVDKHAHGAVRFYHPSFADYATDPLRSGDLYIHPNDRNIELAGGCLATMRRELRFNICELKTSYLPNDQVPNLAERIKSKITGPLDYACTYWISHLTSTPMGTLINELEEQLNSPRQLYWIEVLSLLNRITAGLTGLLELKGWLLDSSMDLAACIDEMYRFISAFYDAISVSTPHLYLSALAFAPRLARTTLQFSALFPNAVSVTSGGDTSWPDWLRAFVIPALIESLAISPDGRFVVIGCLDGKLRIWDIELGILVGGPLVGHSGSVTSVAFSPDGARIVSGSWDSTVRLWEAESGAAIHEPLAGHSGTVQSVAFSPDGTRIVSSSDDKTVRLWDTESGTSIHEPLVGHSERVNSIAFSPDGTRIASGSDDTTVRLWDPKTGTAINEPLVGHSSFVSSVAFSSDGTRIVSGSWDNTVRVWDAKSGASINDPLVGHSSFVTSVAFSPDGTRVVSGSWDRTVRLWDTESGAAISEPLLGHSSQVNFVIFSPDGTRVISSSGDSTLRLWDTKSELGAATNEPLAGHFDHVDSVAFSSDGTRIVSGSWDSTVRLWDARSGAAIRELLIVPSAQVRSVAFSPDGTRIVSAFGDNALRLWDTESGAAIHEPLIGHSKPVGSVAFSPDGSRVVSGSWDSTIRLWDCQSGAPINEPLVGHSEGVYSVAFSFDGTRIVSGSEDKTVRLWDAQSGVAVHGPLVGHSGSVMSVAFSPDGTRIASASDDKTVRLWDTQSGASIHEPLVGHSELVSSVGFSPDGTWIVSGSWDRTVRLWDARTGAAISESLVRYSGSVTSVAFSPDGTRTVSGSWDSTVRLWDVGTGTVGPDLTNSSCSQSHNHSQPPLQWPPHTFALPPHPTYQGWVSLDGKSLLLWLPPHYRRTYSPRLLYSISAEPSQSTIYLDFSKFAHGSSWASIACDKVRQNLV